MRKRKIIHVTVGLASEGDGYVVGLCNDGTVWRIWNNREWEQVKPIPQERDSDKNVNRYRRWG